jgi:hypothetical protein
MTREKTILLLTVLIFLGMVGIYYGLWLAYQFYKQQQNSPLAQLLSNL